MEESRMGEDGDKVFFGGEHLVHCFSFDWSTGWARDKARYVETDWKMRGWNQFIWIWSRCLFVTSSLRFAQTVPPSDKEPPAHPGGVSLPLTPLYWLLVGFYCGFLFFCSFDSIPFRFILSNYCCPILLAVEWWVVFFTDSWFVIPANWIRRTRRRIRATLLIFTTGLVQISDNFYRIHRL